MIETGTFGCLFFCKVFDSGSESRYYRQVKKWKDRSTPFSPDTPGVWVNASSFGSSKFLRVPSCARFFNERQVSYINNRKVAPNNVNDDLFNEKIPFREVLVIDADGTQLGVKSRREALDIAYRQNLDLLCVAPKARPAVCKVLDYGRYHFEQQKKAKESKRKQHTVEMKALRLSPVVDTHDFETKLKHAMKWLESGMKVKIDMRFRGRMMTRQEVGRQIMNQFVDAVKEVAVVEKRPSLEGNTMSVVLAPKKKNNG